MIKNIIIYTISLLFIVISNQSPLELNDSSQALMNEQQLMDKTLFPHTRPTGYDEPVLTDDVAKEIFYEAETMLAQISHSGFNLSADSESWIANPEHQVDPEKVQGLDIFYFRPELSNMDEFDLYFGQVFSDNTLERFKTELRIAEYDGNVAGINFSAGAVGSSMKNWELSLISKIEIDEQNSTAIVTVQPYYYGYEYSLIESEDYIFEYSQEWGWRIVLDKLSDV